MKRMPYSILTTGAACLLVLSADFVFACPLCGQSTEAAAPGLAQGFTASILLMMSMPFLLVTGFGVAFWRLSKRGGNEGEDNPF